MKTIRAIFYRPKIDKHWIDNFIAFWGLVWNWFFWFKKRLWTSHSEIWIPNKKWDFEFLPHIFNGVHAGITFTSTMGQTGGKNRTGDGVRKALASEILKHPDRWYYYEIEVSDHAFQHMLRWMETQVANNQGYNKKDILDFFWPKQEQDLQHFICSGFSWAAIWIALNEDCKISPEYKPTHLPSPMELSHLVIKLGYKPIDLATGKELL